MSGWDRHLRTVRRHTEPTAPAIERLRRAALAAEDAPRGRWWLLLVTVPAVAAVAWFVATRPAPVLAPVALGGEVRLTEDVALTCDGLGSASGSPSAPRIRWESGDLHVDVTPNRGIDLVVETVEARIEVVGTAFDVRRTALGTTVEVARGRVAVDCRDGGRRILGAGEQVTCLPTTAAAWTGRARALRAADRPDVEVLDAIDRGLALAHAGRPERGELLVLRLGVLIRAGRDAEARDTAEAYLASGETARRAEVRAIAEGLRRR
ncbi:MAG: FecR domain-containing protein [Myxococcota bacterium]